MPTVVFCFLFFLLRVQRMEERSFSLLLRGNDSSILSSPDFPQSRPCMTENWVS